MSYEELIIAMEWGYKAHEKGWNIQKAEIEFNRVINNGRIGINQNEPD